jgi:hypothetical protein
MSHEMVDRERQVRLELLSDLRLEGLPIPRWKAEPPSAKPGRFASIDHAR